MAIQDPVAVYEAKKKENAVLFVVFFRGHWCPFCMGYLTALEKLRTSIEERKGTVLAVTAEPESQLTDVHKIFTGQIISDPEHKLARYLREAKLIDIAESPKSGYPNGMAQPGVLVMEKNKLLYSWAIVPSTMNLGGAKDRPSIAQITENVFAQMDGKQQPHKTLDTQTFWQGIRYKLFGSS